MLNFILSIFVATLGFAQSQGKVPSQLTQKQGEYYLRLQEDIADADSRFAHLARKGGAKLTRPDGNVDIPLDPLAKPLPDFDFGGVSDPSRNDSFLYFEGTPFDPPKVFKDYKEAIRALFPNAHEERFEHTHWRIIVGNLTIDLRRDKEHLNLRTEDPYAKITLSISRLS
jgi:hypothetical protein